MTERLNVLLARLRKAMTVLGYTHDALAAAMIGQPDRSYVTRVVDGEKPLSGRFLLALPDDIRALLAEEDAAMFGLIVVRPAHGEQAVRNLVSGLCGVLGVKVLPVKADHMVKVTERVRHKKSA